MSCLTLAIIVGLGLPGWLRILAAACLWPIWRSGRNALGAGGPPGRLAVREDGQWLWQPSGGEVSYVQLAGAPQHLGSLWWLPVRQAHTTQWVLIDAAVMEPAAFSALQCSLQRRNLSTGTEFGDASQANC